MTGKNLPISWKEEILFSFKATSNIYHRNLIYKMGKSGVALFSEMRE